MLMNKNDIGSVINPAPLYENENMREANTHMFGLSFSQRATMMENILFIYNTGISE